MLTKVIEAYKRIENSIRVDYHLDRVTYDAPVNFNESLQRPRHRWFPYKEGFSPSFVRSFLQRYSGRRYIRVLDPFAGVGTTIIEAATIGHEGLGIEVNPLAFFVAQTKTIVFSNGESHEFADAIQSFTSSPLRNMAPPPDNKTVRSYFEEPYLEALLRVKSFFLSLSAGQIQDLFKVAFLSIIETFSTHRRAGNGVKKRTTLAYRDFEGDALGQIRNIMLRLLNVYYEDLANNILPSETKFVQGNSLEMEGISVSTPFNCVLTSPPYANCFDYSKIYLRELWLGDFFTSADSQKDFRMKSVRSHVHAKWASRYEDKGSQVVNEIIYPMLLEKKLWSKLIPDMLKGYFMDLGKLFEALYPILEKQAPVGIVVGNSVYGGIPVATDLLLSETAAHQGFKTERIEVYRYIIPSSQQYVQLNNKEYFRESMVVLRRI